MSISPAPSRRTDASPQVTRWRAEKARRTAREASGRTPARQRYAWPADRQAILAETTAAARIRPAARPAPAGGNP